MPGYSLDPVQGDPFAASPAPPPQQAQTVAPKYTLEPVDGDPFASKSTGADVLSGTNRGLISGVGSLLGLPGDVANAVTKGSYAALAYPVSYGAEKLGLISPETGERLRQQPNYGPKFADLVTSEPITKGLTAGANALGVNTDKPTSTAGKYAETIGSFLPTAATMGAGTIGSAAKAALRYGVIPGAASEAAGEATEGTAAEPYARLGAAVATGGFAKGKGVRPEALDAHDAGYVLTPAYISEKPGMVAGALSGIGGKKILQDASEKNQYLSNTLAKRGLGLPDDADFSNPKTFDQVRNIAGQNYANVENAIQTVRPDFDFVQNVSGLGGANSAARKAFPKTSRNPAIDDVIDDLSNAGDQRTSTWLEKVKDLRYQGNLNLKAPGDPHAHALGLAQRQAADEIDDLIQRSLVTQGADPALVDSYKEARKLIAKSYDVQGATNPVTGDVNALGLGRLKKTGRPLTDELDTIASAALAFPKVMQAPAGFGHAEPMGPLDFFGALHAGASGHPAIMAGIAGRPAVRAALLSSPGQAILARQTPSAPVPKSVRLGLLGRQSALSTPEPGGGIVQSP